MSQFNICEAKLFLQPKFNVPAHESFKTVHYTYTIYFCPSSFFFSVTKYSTRSNLKRDQIHFSSQFEVIGSHDGEVTTIRAWGS